jgi:hypothetical protein
MNAQVDVLEFNNAMKEIERETGVLADDIMLDNAALMCADLIRSTPPGKVGAQSEFDSRKMLEGKIDRDIRGLVYGIEGGFSKAIIGKAKAEGKTYTLFRDNRDVISLADEDKLDPSGTSIAELHNKSRGKGGNVLQSAKNDARGRRVILDHKALRKRAAGATVGKSLWLTEKILTRASVLRRFVREQITHIGKTKAGWLPAFTEAMKYAITARYSPPAWVTRHAGVGSFTIEKPSGGTYGFFEAVNSVPWIKKTKVAAMVDSIMRTRARDFQRGYYAKRLQTIMDAKRSNYRN